MRISTISIMMDVMRRLLPESTEGGSAAVVIYARAKSASTASVTTIIRYPICVCL